MQKVEAHILTKPQEERGWSCKLLRDRLDIYLKDVLQFSLSYADDNPSIWRVRQRVDEVEKKLSLAGTYSIEEG